MQNLRAKECIMRDLKQIIPFPFLVLFNPSNANIKMKILICYPYTFSLKVVGRIC